LGWIRSRAGFHRNPGQDPDKTRPKQTRTEAGPEPGREPGQDPDKTRPGQTRTEAGPEPGREPGQDPDKTRTGGPGQGSRNPDRTRTESTVRIPGFSGKPV